MKMNKKFCFSLIWLIMSTFTPLQAQSEVDYYYKNISLQDGLSQSSVTSVASDRNGSLWIGTRYGLNQYQNQQVSPVGTFGYVNCIHSGPDGTMWIGTPAGLYRGNCDTQEFSPVDSHNALCVLQREDGIYAGCEGGVAFWDGTWCSFSGLQGGYITALYEYDGGILAVDKGLGVFYLSEDRTFERWPGYDTREHVIMCSALDGDTLYLGLYRQGLMILDLKTGNMRILNTSNSDLSFDIILSLLQDGDDLWMGTDGGGIDIYSTTKKTIRHMPVPSKSITSLYRDSFSNVWAGTVSSGLYGLRPSRILSYDVDNSELAYNVVLDMCADADSNVWIGTDGGGVSLFSAAGAGLTTFPATAGLKVSSIVKMDGDVLLLSLYNRGLTLFNCRTGRLTPFTLVDRKTDEWQFFYGNSPSLYDLGGGHYLILAINVYDYDKNTRTFTQFVSDGNTPLYDMKLCGRKDGVLYAYNADGVFVLDPERHSVRKLCSGADRITAASYGDDIIWIGNSEGLYRFDVPSSTLEKVSTNLFRRVTYLRCTSQGDLWIAADNTLFRKTGQLITLVGENEGVGANELVCGVEAVSGGVPTLFLGGSNGLLKIRLNEKSARPLDDRSLVLRSASVDGETRDISSGRLSIREQYSRLSLNVTLAPSDPFERNVYRYSVSGRSGYSVESYNDVMTLPELKDGTYNIDVSYFKGNGEWSEPVRVLALKVLPPWYRSAWFVIMLTVIMIGCTIAVLLRIYRRKILSIQRSLRASNRDFVEKLDGYISANLSDPALDIPSIANYMAMSRASLYSKFKSVIGGGIGEYIDSLRMKEACRLLSQTALPVSEIAERVGYSNSSYFSTRFRKIIGQAPREYRAKNR